MGHGTFSSYNTGEWVEQARIKNLSSRRPMTGASVGKGEGPGREVVLGMGKALYLGCGIGK